MIALRTALTNAAMALALTCPQLVSADEISDLQVATMGMPATERVEVICDGREFTALCEQLINDPDYRDQWLETGDILTRAEWRIAAILVELSGQIDRQNEALQLMIERAPRLPDGRAIFRAEDGRYVDIDGNLVSAAEVATAR